MHVDTVAATSLQSRARLCCLMLAASYTVYASPLLRTLNWLPVQQRIDYKAALLTFKARSISTP